VYGHIDRYTTLRVVSYFCVSIEVTTRRREISVEEMVVNVKSAILRGDVVEMRGVLDVCRRAVEFGQRAYPEKMEPTRRFIRALEVAIQKAMRRKKRGGGK